MRGLDGINVAAQRTNVVFIGAPPIGLNAFRSHMEKAGIRMATHVDIDDAAVERTIDAFREFSRG